MTNNQVSKKNMYDKVRKFLNDNGSIWLLFMPLVDAVAQFFHDDDELEKFMGKQAASTKGITADKKQKLKDAVTLTVQLARKGRAWAHTTGNTELEADFNVRADDFTQKADSEALSAMKTIRKKLNDNLGSLAAYNITALTITALDDKIKAFEDVIAAPGDAESSKILGTEAIDAFIHSIDADLEVIDDLLVTEYFETEREMVEQYKIERRIDTVGIHHTRIDAHVAYSDGSGNAQGITMHVVEPNKTAVSDIEGNINGPNMKPGTFHVEISGPNIVSQSLIITVKRGTTVHLEITVVKI